MGIGHAAKEAAPGADLKSMRTMRGQGSRMTQDARAIKHAATARIPATARAYRAIHEYAELKRDPKANAQVLLLARNKLWTDIRYFCDLSYDEGFFITREIMRRNIILNKLVAGLRFTVDQLPNDVGDHIHQQINQVMEKIANEVSSLNSYALALTTRAKEGGEIFRFQGKGSDIGDIVAIAIKLRRDFSIISKLGKKGVRAVRDDNAAHLHEVQVAHPDTDSKSAKAALKILARYAGVIEEAIQLDQTDEKILTSELGNVIAELKKIYDELERLDLEDNYKGPTLKVIIQKIHDIQQRIDEIVAEERYLDSQMTRAEEEAHAKTVELEDYRRRHPDNQAA